MADSADPDQLASSEANWSGSTLFAKTGYIRVQQDKGFNDNLYVLLLTLEMRLSPVSILRKSISGRHRAFRVADGPMTARCRFS